MTEAMPAIIAADSSSEPRLHCVGLKQCRVTSSSCYSTVISAGQLLVLYLANNTDSSLHHLLHRMPYLFTLAGGRYLQDLWVYNLNRLQWTAPAATVEQPQDAAEGGEEEGAALLAPAGPPASAGWSVTPFQDKLLVLGGHMKVGKVRMGRAGG